MIHVHQVFVCTCMVLSLCLHVSDCLCVYVCVCVGERQSVCVSVDISLVSSASPFQQNMVESGTGDTQSPRSSARPLLMRTFSDESSTVI